MKWDSLFFDTKPELIVSCHHGTYRVEKISKKLIRPNSGIHQHDSFNNEVEK
jgi:hypothetical protein